MLQKQDGGPTYQGDIHWGAEEVKEHINILELRAATLALKAFLPPQLLGPKHVHLWLDNITAGAYINKEGGGLPSCHSPSPGTMGSALGCSSIPDSTAHSWHSEYSSRYSFQADRDQNRMNLRQENLPIHFSEVLQNRSGSLCIPLKLPNAPVCFEVPRSGSTSDRCLSPGLELVGLSNPPRHSSS